MTQVVNHFSRLFLSVSRLILPELLTVFCFIYGLAAYGPPGEGLARA